MDSTQYSSERKERYKLILDHLQNLRDGNTGEQSPVERLRDLQERIRNNNDIHKEGTSAIEELINNNTEVLMDAQVLKSAHEVLSKIFSTNSEFNNRIYANALKSLIYKNDTVNWEAISQIAVKVSNAVYTKSSLLGAEDIELKERIIKEHQKRNKSSKGTAQEKRPETASKLKRSDRGAEKLNMILKQVNAIFKSNNCQPIPYYKLIIDPNNFMKTVENAFQISFLARDGNVAIETGSGSHPQVRCVRLNELPETDVTSQSICSVNMKFCQEMAQFYNIQEPMIQIPDDLSESDDDDDDDDHNDSDSDNGNDNDNEQACSDSQE